MRNSLSQIKAKPDSILNSSDVWSLKGVASPTSLLSPPVESTEVYLDSSLCVLTLRKCFSEALTLRMLVSS